jgi:hypothetical protein
MARFHRLGRKRWDRRKANADDQQASSDGIRADRRFD